MVHTGVFSLWEAAENYERNICDYSTLALVQQMQEECCGSEWKWGYSEMCGSQQAGGGRGPSQDPFSLPGHLQNR